MSKFNSGVAKRHYDAIWDIKWVCREHVVGTERSKVEFLYTISSDGRVLEWSVKKGLESSGTFKMYLF